MSDTSTSGPLREQFDALVRTVVKARALVRIATPETEAPLVELARYTTAAQLDRIARARANVETGDDAENAARRHEARHLRWFWDDDGSLVLTAQPAADEGALVLQALDARRPRPPPPGSTWRLVHRMRRCRGIVRA